MSQARRHESFDAIVVGAGPSGSTSAYLLARAGLSTLLVDRATFPRDKPCGGGITLRAAALLPFSLDPVVEELVEDEVEIVAVSARTHFIIIERGGSSGAET